MRQHSIRWSPCGASEIPVPSVGGSILPIWTEQLQVGDDVINILVCQHDETAQRRGANRVLRLREVEEPLVVSDGVAKRLAPLS